MRELWIELGATMRALRRAAGVSLRQAEADSGVGRGTLSQVENGKARANRGLVEWYETALHGDGLLMSMYVEARGALPAPAARRTSRHRIAPGDVIEVSDPTVASGLLVAPGTRVDAGWTLRNCGVEPWSGRRLRRVGAHAATRLICTEPATSVPDCGPKEAVDVVVRATVPSVLGTFAAYWQLVDEDDSICSASDLLALVVVVG